MNDRHQKVSICTVIAIDIFDQSSKPVYRQIQDKGIFCNILNEALQDVSADDRIRVDTGEGAAIALFGAPESAIFIAMMVRDAIDKYNNTVDEKLFIRTGISIGPVRATNEANGIYVIHGDGLEVANRLKSLAAPNQILVSRAFYDITAGLTEEIAAMFSRVAGEHEMYTIRPSQEQPFVPESAAALANSQPLISRLMENDNSRRYGLWGSAALVALVILAGGFMLNPHMLQPDLGVVVTDPEQTAPVADLHAVSIPTTSSQLAAPVMSNPTPDTVEPTNELSVEGLDSTQQVATPARRTLSTPRQSTAAPSEVETSEARSEEHAMTETEETVAEEPVVVSPPETRRVATATPQLTGPTVEERRLPVNHDPPRNIWNAFRESFKQGSTQQVCTQAEMALNQCK